MVYSSEEQPINLKAVAWTVGAHALLLLLFFFVKYSLPQVPPVQEMGVEVNLGTDADGSGDDQPMDMDDPAPDNATGTNTALAAENTESRDMMESDEPDAPEVTRTTAPRTNTRTVAPTATATTRPRPNPTQQPTSNNNPQPQRQQPRYVYGGATGRGGNSAAENRAGTGEGNTTGPGDRGVPGGTPGATNYTGTPGRGTGGISHTLRGRNIVAFPPPEAEFKEGGKVVIRVTVDRNGTIVNRQVRSASNNELRTIALRKLDKVKFNKNPDAPEEQFGDITFVFKTRS